MQLLHKHLTMTLILVSLCFAAVVDRVALVVNKTVITESEVLDQLRLMDFINGHAVDLAPNVRRSAAERIVDQELIRNEMQVIGFHPLPASEGDALLRNFRQERFSSVASFRAALQTYGITEGQLKEYLLWQLTAIRFTDYRFRSESPAVDSQSADRAVEVAPSSVDERLDMWLKQARSTAKISFKQEAFQ